MSLPEIPSVSDEKEKATNAAIQQLTLAHEKIHELGVRDACTKAILDLLAYLLEERTAHSDRSVSASTSAYVEVLEVLHRQRRSQAAALDQQAAAASR